MSAADCISVFLLALAGSVHCAGMCGVFSIAITANARNSGAIVARQIAYQFGKATAYLCIGVILLLAGMLLTARQNIAAAQNVLSVFAGVLMIIAGLTYSLEWRLPVAAARWWHGSATCGALAALWRSPSLFKSVLAGWLNGFLPCGLSFTALLYIASFNSVQALVAGTYLFGLGTLPVLLAVAFLGQRMAISLRTRRWMLRVSGVLLAIFGVLTLLRGNVHVHAWIHEHLIPASVHGGAHAPDAPGQEICH